MVVVALLPPLLPAPPCRVHPKPSLARLELSMRRLYLLLIKMALTLYRADYPDENYAREIMQYVTK